MDAGGVSSYWKRVFAVTRIRVMLKEHLKVKYLHDAPS